MTPKHNDTAAKRSRQDAGRRAEMSGQSAEMRVAQAYQRLGYDLIARRWRGTGGEIDLIFGRNDMRIFTEVKKARSADAAIRALLPAQMQRIHMAASEYLADTPMGQLTEVRFDLGIMDGTGRVQIIENAFGHF